jgi:hypothetical protein
MKPLDISWEKYMKFNAMIKSHGKKCVPYQVWAKAQAKDFEKRLRQSIRDLKNKKRECLK